MSHLRPEHEGTPFSELGKRDYKALMDAGFTTLAHVRMASDAQLLRTKGMGRGSLNRIRAVIGGGGPPSAAPLVIDPESDREAIVLLRRIALAVERLAESQARSRRGRREGQAPDQPGPRSRGPRD